jgi:osmotically-inducible protein OsmY
MSRHRQPEIRYESSGTSFFALIGAMGLGAALMYFLDPDTGKRRRALARDKYVHGKTALQDATEAAVRNAANQTRGAIARVQNRIASKPEEMVDDSILLERVRAAMGHVITDPHAIEIRVNEGCVILKGPALPHEIGELVACAERVRGVREVDNRLSVSNPS